MPGHSTPLNLKTAYLSGCVCIPVCSKMCKDSLSWLVTPWSCFSPQIFLGPEPPTNVVVNRLKPEGGRKPLHTGIGLTGFETGLIEWTHSIFNKDSI